MRPLKKSCACFCTFSGSPAGLIFSACIALMIGMPRSGPTALMISIGVGNGELRPPVMGVGSVGTGVGAGVVALDSGTNGGGTAVVGAAAGAAAAADGAGGGGAAGAGDGAAVGGGGAVGGVETGIAAGTAGAAAIVGGAYVAPREAAALAHTASGIGVFPPDLSLSSTACFSSGVFANWSSERFRCFGSNVPAGVETGGVAAGGSLGGAGGVAVSVGGGGAVALRLSADGDANRPAMLG